MYAGYLAIASVADCAITRLPSDPAPISLTRDSGLRFPLRIRVENQLAHPALPGGVDDGTQQREAAALAVDVILPGRKRDVAGSAAAARFPDRETDQLESIEWAVCEMQLGIGELPGRVAPVVWRNLDRHGDCSLSAITFA